MADIEPDTGDFPDDSGAVMTPAQHAQFEGAHLDAAAVHLAEAQAHHHAQHAPVEDTADASDAESSPGQDDTSRDDTRAMPALRVLREGFRSGSVNERTAARIRGRM